MKARFNAKKGVLEAQDPITKDWLRICYVNKGESINLESIIEQYNITEISYIKERKI